jgi:hypothetical protein
MLHKNNKGSLIQFKCFAISNRKRQDFNIKKMSELSKAEEEQKIRERERERKRLT